MLTRVYPKTPSPDEYAINLHIATENISEMQYSHIVFNLIFKSFLWEKIIFPNKIYYWKRSSV